MRAKKQVMDFFPVTVTSGVFLDGTSTDLKQMIDNGGGKDVTPDEIYEVDDNIQGEPFILSTGDGSGTGVTDPELVNKVNKLIAQVGAKYFVYLTQAEYDQLTEKDANTIYFITDSENANKAYIDEQLKTKANVTHTHTMEDISNLNISSKTVIKKYIHSGNISAQPTGLVLETGVFEFAQPHGFVQGDSIMVVNNGIAKWDKYFSHLPKELAIAKTNGWKSSFKAVVVDDTHIKIAVNASSLESPLTFTADSSYVEDLTAFHFEKCVNDKVNLTGLEFKKTMVDKIKIIVRSNGNIRKFTVDSTPLNRYWINPKDGQIPSFTKSNYNPHLIDGDGADMYAVGCFLNFSYSLDLEIIDEHIQVKNEGQLLSSKAAEYPRMLAQRLNSSVFTADTCDNLASSNIQISAYGFFANGDEITIIEM